MKILLVHNSYQNHGGEDAVFINEKKLLTAAGHRVSTYTRSNEEINEYGWMQRASLAPRTVWARDSLKQMRQRIAAECPDVAHFHNTFPLISPSAYLACQEAGVCVVQTLHNPRLMCPAATLYRNGNTCEECLGKRISWPGVLHGCYRDSRIQTGIVATMLAVHRQMKTWETLVDKYIASTEFFSRKFVKAGLPSSKISVKPHFVARSHQNAVRDRKYALFVGRLAPEKGVLTLLDAWKLTGGVPLRIRGEGPLVPRVQECVEDPRLRIDWVPRLAEEELIRFLSGSPFSCLAF